MKKTVLLLLLVFIIAGGYIRVIQMDRPIFWVDEFLHVVSARGIVESGRPMLSSDSHYHRSLIYTYTVSLFFKLFGINEITARLPSVIFGILMIPLIYYVASRLINRNVGIFSAFLVAFSSQCVHWSSMCRMYSLLQPLYLLAAFYFFKSLEWKDEVYNEGHVFYNMLKKWLVFSLIFVPAFFVHELAILLIPTILMYILLIFILIIFRNGLKSAFHTKYFKEGVWILGAGVVLALSVGYVLRKSLWLHFTSSPVWLPPDRSRDIFFYIRMLRQDYPILYYCYPAAIVILILKKPKVGLYMGSCFLVPLMLLSCIFAWKVDRYIFFVLPFFFITASFIFDRILCYFWKLFRRLTSGSLLNNGLARVNKGIIFIRLILVIFITFPFLVSGMGEMGRWAPSVNSGEFRKIIDNIKEKIKPEDVIVSEGRLFVEYYFSRKPNLVMNFDVPYLNDVRKFQSLENSGKNVWVIMYNVFNKKNCSYIRKHVVNDYKLCSSAKIRDGIYYKSAKKLEFYCKMSSRPPSR